MSFFDKIKDLGSRIVKPVIKPFNPAKLPVLRKLPDVVKPVNGGHSYVKPNGTTGWVSYK